MFERNPDLFHAIAEAIHSEPDRYCQGVWVESTADTPCGTRACIAGHAVLLSDAMLYADDEVWEVAAAALGLAENEAATLFHEKWRPRADLEVWEALKLLADGAPVAEVTAPSAYRCTQTRPSPPRGTVGMLARALQSAGQPVAPQRYGRYRP